MILSTQFAFAGNADVLKLAIDEFHFAMEVEWDQRDQSFAQVQQLILEESIKDLVEKGLSLEELKSSFNANTLESFDQLEFEMIQNNINNPEDVQKFIISKMQSNYQTGASWENAGADILGALGVGLFLAIIIYPIASCMARSTPGNSYC